MADNHRNQGRDYRSSEWNDTNDRNQERNWEDRNYGSTESGTGNSWRYGQHDEGNVGSRWNRDSDYNRESGSGKYNRDYNSGNSNYGNQSQNYGYGGREYGSNYGGGNYQGNSSYYNSGPYGSGSGRSSYGDSRNLYDRDYEGYNRDSNRGNYTGMGASNYGGNMEDRGRWSNYDEDRSYRGYSSSNYGGNQYGGSQRSRYGRGDSNERSWWDRTRDEVSSWFGDDDAERRRERDRQQNFKGKGPRNYSRSDDRIKEDINDRLSDDPWIDATEIDVTVNNGEVTLTGTVVERSAKRRAEDLAEQVSGVKNVENRIRVGQTTSSNTGSSSPVAGGSTYGNDTSASQTGVTGSSTSERSKSKSGYVTG